MERMPFVNSIKTLLIKYRDIIAYLFFGVCTTLVNIVAYWAAAHPLGMGTLPASVLAWVAAVLFAYVTNRKWVFRSQAVTRQEITREITSFFGCRLATGVVDWVIMFVCVDLLCFNDMVIKIFANVVVVILNYVANKLLIFKNKNT